jgi:hypothetical protein
VAVAAGHGEPPAVHGDDGDALAGRGLEVVVADGRLGAVGEGREEGLGGGEVGGRLAGDRADDGAALELERGEHVAGVGHVDADERDLRVAGALVREVVEHAAADLEEAGRGDRVEVVDDRAHAQGLAAALDVEVDGLADAVVEGGLERDEPGDALAVDASRMSPGSSRPSVTPPGRRFSTIEQAGGLGRGVADGLLARGAQAEAAQLVVRRVHEGRHQGAARDVQAGADALEREDDAVEREEEAGGGLGPAAGVEGDDVAVRCRRRASRTSRRRCRRRPGCRRC